MRRFKKENYDILNEYFSKEKYPTYLMKKEICEKTRLSIDQVNAWFKQKRYKYFKCHD
jgi:hypothetical protein